MADRVRVDAPLMIVEDSEADYDTLSFVLEKLHSNLPIVRFSTGEEAVKFMSAVSSSSHGRRSVPVHILLDLNLPGMDGKQVLEAARRNPVFASVPITILTTSSSPKDIDACYRAGATSYLIKPVDFDRMENMLASFNEYWLKYAELPSLRTAYSA